MKTREKDNFAALGGTEKHFLIMEMLLGKINRDESSLIIQEQFSKKSFSTFSYYFRAFH